MDIFVSALLGLLTAALVELGKKTGVSVSTLFTGLAVIAGIVWASFEYFAPAEIVTNVFDYAGLILGRGAIAYSVIVSGKKLLQGKDNPSV